MIQPLINTAVTDFNKETLTELKPYFNIDHKSTQKELWFKNLLILAQHSLGIAHCVFHHQGARLAVMTGFDGNAFPDFYLNSFDQQIGALSNAKTSDDVILKNNVVTGTKHWISNLHQADFGVFAVKAGKQEAMVLYDFTTGQHKFQFYNDPLGMEIAKPGSIINNCYTVPTDYVLGYRIFTEPNGKFSIVSSFTDYGFITNYLGLILSLFKDLKKHIEQNNINVQFELDQLGLDISTLKLVWADNLPSVNETNFTDQFWHKRNTQYTQSKKILLSLITLLLKAGDPRWLDVKSLGPGQRFRDALVFSTHQKSLYRNLKDRNFVNLQE
jgi:hypothetical protein